MQESGDICGDKPRDPSEGTVRNQDPDLTIVAVHGVQGTRASWQSVAQSLSREAHWVLPNLRGRGNAFRGSSSADYGLEQFADDMGEVITRDVSTSRIVLAGWSMGVSVVLATVAMLQKKGLRLPDALILMSGSPVLAQTHWFHETDNAALLKEVAAREHRLGLREAADRDAVAWTWQAIGNSDQRPMLPLLNIPTLIVHGNADEDSPFAHAKLLEQALPLARLRTIDGGTHSILMQNTAQVAEEVRTFLSDIHLSRSFHEK